MPHLFVQVPYSPEICPIFGKIEKISQIFVKSENF